MVSPTRAFTVFVSPVEKENVRSILSRDRIHRTERVLERLSRPHESALQNYTSAETRAGTLFLQIEFASRNSSVDTLHRNNGSCGKNRMAQRRCNKHRNHPALLASLPVRYFRSSVSVSRRSTPRAAQSRPDRRFRPARTTPPSPPRAPSTGRSRGCDCARSASAAPSARSPTPPFRPC